jgi:hypothetical protein
MPLIPLNLVPSPIEGEGMGKRGEEMERKYYSR